MEKYGTIPPKFTKAWWAHYWHYYRFHICLGLIILIGAVYLVVALSNKVEYDLNIEIVTEDVLLSPDADSAVRKMVNSLASDITGDNAVEVEYQNDIYSSSPENNPNHFQQNNALITRIMAEVELGKKQLYIVDKTTADYLIDFQCLVPVSKWAEDVPKELIYGDVFLSLDGNMSFSKMSFDTSNLYMGVLELRDKLKDDKILIAKQENAEYVARELIKED